MCEPVNSTSENEGVRETANADKLKALASVLRKGESK